MSGEICQDCWEPFMENPLCICRATYEPCPVHGGGPVFTTPREKQAGTHPINCPKSEARPVRRLVERIARWCVVAALFTLTLPAGVVGGYFLAALAVSR